MLSIQKNTAYAEISLLVVEDHPVYLEGLTFVLNKLSHQVNLVCVNTIAEAQNILSNTSSFDLILLDLTLPGDNGLSLFSFLKAEQLFIPVAMLSASEEPRDIQASMTAGASGFISKASRSEELLSAIHCILKGEHYLPSFYAKLARPPSPKLTPRQKEVLFLLAEGLPNKRICQQLNITEHTIKSHLKSLFALLHVHTRTECAKAATELGLLI